MIACLDMALYFAIQAHLNTCNHFCTVSTKVVVCYNDCKMARYDYDLWV